MNLSALYASWLQSKGLSGKSVTLYLQCVLGWRRRFGETALPVPETLHDWWEVEKIKNSNTANLALAGMRHWVAYLQEQGQATAETAAVVRALRPARVQALAPKSLASADAKCLWRHVLEHETPQDRALLALFMFCGLRVGEICALQWTDTNGDHLIVRNGKGNKTRTVPIPPVVAKALAALTERQGFVFGGEKPMTYISVYSRLMRLGANAGVAVRITPHQLRHTFAYRYLETNPGDLVGLSQIMGHSTINTTARYTQKRLGQLQEASARVTF